MVVIITLRPSSRPMTRNVFSSRKTLRIGEILAHLPKRWCGSGPKPADASGQPGKKPGDAAGGAGHRRTDRAGDVKRATKFPMTLRSSRWTPTALSAATGIAVNFLSPFLVEAYRTLTRSESVVGSNRAVERPGRHRPREGKRRIRDAYTQARTYRRSIRAARALWYHKTGIVTQSMLGGDRRLHRAESESKRHLADQLLGAARPNAVAYPTPA